MGGLGMDPETAGMTRNQVILHTIDKGYISRDVEERSVLEDALSKAKRPVDFPQRVGALAEYYIKGPGQLRPVEGLLLALIAVQAGDKPAEKLVAAAAKNELRASPSAPKDANASIHGMLSRPRLVVSNEPGLTD